MGKENKLKKFNTFSGVFVPDVLTILGVIMYLRLGWVVGNAGFFGAVLIILLAKTITIFTSLSMSSITTNIRIGPGGAYSIISKSLGLEAGGSVGIPFYISQTLSAALYIIGFATGWVIIFPSHQMIPVCLISWAILLLISSISARFAIKIQYIIMVAIILSIASFLGTRSPAVEHFQLIGKFENAGFWKVFAIFFPAVTGIMAGANMSGELEDPKRSIPLGTLSAVGLTLLIYILMAYFAAKFIPANELRENSNAFVTHSFFPPFVLAGILSATFSSALSAMVGAPRILQALAEKKTVPFHDFFAVKSKGNEPRNAIIFTGVFIIIAILAGNLDALATLITMFFLITYGTLNLVVFIQQSMKIISFRPTFSIPRWVSFAGALGCMVVMFLINPIFSVIAMMIILGLYIWLAQKELELQSGDIRGGIFVVLAEKASRIADSFPRHKVSWKPDLLVPVDDPDVWANYMLFLRDIIYPSGSLFFFTVQNEDIQAHQEKLNNLTTPLKNEDFWINTTVIQDSDFMHGAKLVMQTLKGGTLRPNTLFLTMGDNFENDHKILFLTEKAHDSEMGMIVLYKYLKTEFGMKQTVNLWLRDASPNWHLALLVALHLQLNWDAKLNLITVTDDEHEEQRLSRFLERLSDHARLPSQTYFHVLICDFNNALLKAPKADVNIFGLAENPSLDFMRKLADETKSSCLFIKDSGKENAFI